MDPSPLVFFLKVLNVEDKYEHKKIYQFTDFAISELFKIWVFDSKSQCKAVKK